ncbi:probable transmembrane reductase CYB561D1 [Bombina bombina]|uniref:probable transmembrane reductase CYB561D1 n=1 Tax=Bombina bombina TaxID=8345 RepID=UPI00235AAD83|nr:probable transmembrane reductase CYB561D1 [Bombina bombina]XP_053562741.1 probable transmembrane reductase CYB561D1 [Bombina bombina]
MPELPVLYTQPGAESQRGTDFWLYRYLRRISGFLAHVLALGFTVFLLILARPGTSLFSWHPVFMAVAFCLCMTEAVLLLSPETSPICPLSRKCKTRMHWLAQLCVVVLASIGLVFIVCSKNRSELPHLTSWHSIFGLVTLGSTCCQAVCGLALLCPRMVRVTSVSRLKLYHATCGLLVYLLATATVLLGLCSDWFQAHIKGPVWYVCLFIPLYPALVIMNQVLDIYLPKKKGQM